MVFKLTYTDKRKRIALTVLAFILSVLFAVLIGNIRVNASDFKFQKSKITLAEGNVKKLNLMYNGVEYFQDTDAFDYWSYFYSSDESVVRVDYTGTITCVGTGTAVITACYDEFSATCTIKVKANKLKVSETELVLYSGQSKDIKISGIKKLKEFNATYQVLNSIDDYSWTDAPTIKSNGKGSFTVTAGKKGDYEIRLIGIQKSGKQYSKKITLHTVETGPARQDICVATGYKNSLEMVNSTLTSVSIVRWTVGNYTWYPEDLTESCPITVDSSGTFYASEDADNVIAIYLINFETDDGTQLTQTVSVSTYNPDYEPFSDYLWVGQTYDPKIINGRYSSKVVCTSSNPSVLGTDSSGRLIPLKQGTAEVTIWVDGKVFKDKVKIVDINVDGNNILTWPGANFSFTVTGAPDDMEIKYTSSNTDVATISKKGKLKVKKRGFTMVTVSVDGYEYYYTVNVASETSVKAVIAASEVVGISEYSQSRRMEEGYYDCSSLVWRSYAKAGLKLKNESYAPTAADLAEYLEQNGYTISYGELPVSELLPGDILFSRTPGSYNDRYMNIDHVAMYYSTNNLYVVDDGYSGETLEGSGTIVHAGSGGVKFGSYPSYMNIVMIARLK